MRKKHSNEMSSDQLLAAFVEIGIAQGRASEEFRTGQFNRLFEKEINILEELKRSARATSDGSLSRSTTTQISRSG